MLKHLMIVATAVVAGAGNALQWDEDVFMHQQCATSFFACSVLAYASKRLGVRTHLAVCKTCEQTCGSKAICDAPWCRGNVYGHKSSTTCSSSSRGGSKRNSGTARASSCDRSLCKADGKGGFIDRYEGCAKKVARIERRGSVPRGKKPFSWEARYCASDHAACKWAWEKHPFGKKYCEMCASGCFCKESWCKANREECKEKLYPSPSASPSASTSVKSSVAPSPTPSEISPSPAASASAKPSALAPPSRGISPALTSESLSPSPSNTPEKKRSGPDVGKIVGGIVGFLGLGGAAAAGVFQLARAGLLGWVTNLLPGFNFAQPIENIPWMTERDRPQFDENGAPLLDSDVEAGDEIVRLGDDGWEDMTQAQKAGACHTASRRCLVNSVPQFNFRPGDKPIGIQASVRKARRITLGQGVLRAIRKSMPICTKCMVMCQSCGASKSKLGAACGVNLGYCHKSMDALGKLMVRERAKDPALALIPASLSSAFSAPSPTPSPSAQSPRPRPPRQQSPRPSPSISAQPGGNGVPVGQQVPLDTLAFGVTQALAYGRVAGNQARLLARISYMDWLRVLLPAWERPIDDLKNVPWIASTSDDPTLLGRPKDLTERVRDPRALWLLWDNTVDWDTFPQHSIASNCQNAYQRCTLYNQFSVPSRKLLESLPSCMSCLVTCHACTGTYADKFNGQIFSCSENKATCRAVMETQSKEAFVPQSKADIWPLPIRRGNDPAADMWPKRET